MASMDSDLVLLLQEAQLNGLPIDLEPFFNGYVYGKSLAELSPDEGDLIPLVVRTGPVSKPDPGVLKRYQAVEVNGNGTAFVWVWIHNRLVAKGRLFTQETPRASRRLNIPRGLGNGYSIDLLIAFQGTFTGYEVFYDLVSE
jgi:hypothetical protein